MAIKAAIILVSISIILLAVYGADVAVLHASDTKMGFLPFDHMIRGIGLGMPALILPFVSFIIARKDASKTLGALLIISAILIIAGGIVILGMDPESSSNSTRNPAMEAIPLFIPGGIIAALGAIKLKQS